MPQRRSRRIAGQEPSLVDDESAREVYDQFIALGYSEERAHELVYKDVHDLECFESLSLFAQLITKGFDDEQSLDLVSDGRSQVAMRVHDEFMPLFNNVTFWSICLELSQCSFLQTPLATSCAQRMIATGTIKVEKEEVDEDGDIDVGVGASYVDESSVLLAQDQEILLPSLRKLAAAISSSKRGSITLCIQHMELSKESDGVDDFASALIDSSLEDVSIRNNLIKTEEDAQSLVKAMIGHPKLETAMLDRCGLGRNESVMKSIIPLFGSLNGISLAGNQIGSLGVKLISDCLASNPVLNLLSLKDNLLNDDDAAVLAKSLASNTNLRRLKIAGNSISQVGMKSFHSVIQNNYSFNAISDSNHTCRVVDGDKGLSNFNTWINPMFNKAEKLINVLGNQANMRLLNTLPIELMPWVVYLVQGRGLFRSSLSRTFSFIHQWSMPLLYTSCVGLEPRRSERVRKKVIMKYVAVK